MRFSPPLYAFLPPPHPTRFSASLLAAVVKLFCSLHFKAFVGHYQQQEAEGKGSEAKDRIQQSDSYQHQQHPVTMPIDLISRSSTPCNADMMRQFLNSRSGRISASGNANTQVFSEGALERLTTYVEAANAPVADPSISDGDGASSYVLPVCVAFHMLGINEVTEDMLKELYEAFDVNGRGGVERGVMWEMMRSRFSNYGAPSTEKDVNRLFEHALPFSIRRRLKADNPDDDLMSFNEFCTVFMAWLRL